jgi:HEAT repeat protein
MNAPSGHRPIDEKLYGCMMDFVHRTVSLRRAWVLYGRGNVMLEENLRNWRAASDILLEGREYIEITTAGNKLFFGDTLLGTESPFVRELVETLRRLVIRRLTLLKGIEGEELYQLMDMLSQESRALLVRGGPVAVLGEAGVKKARVIENVYMKRVGQTGEIVLDEGKLTLEDLNFIRGQLKNMLSLAREGFELRSEERGLLAEVAGHPTFMGELLAEMTGAEPGAPPPDPRAQGEEIAEMLDALVKELRRGGICDEETLRKMASSVIGALDEPTRLETLAAEFETAGQVAPMLDDEAFNCSIAQIGRFIVAMFRRDPGEGKRASSLLRRLIPNEDAYREAAARIKSEAEERGVDAGKAVEMLLEALGPMARAVLPAQEGGDAGAIAGRLAPVASVTTADLASSLMAGGEDSREVVVLSELLRECGSGSGLAARASLRIRGLMKKGRGADALALFRGLLSLLAGGTSALAGTVSDEVRGLCADGVLPALLLSPAPEEERIGIMAEIVREMPPADATAVLEALLADRHPELQEVLVEAGRREPAVFAELLRSRMAGGAPGVIAHAVDILRTLPGEISTPILTDLCRHTSAEVRLRAVSVLGKSGGTDAVPLLQILVNDTDAEVRKTAIPLLGHCGGEAAAETLLGIAADPKGVWGGEERVLACRALAKCGGQAAVPVLADVLANAAAGRDKDAQMLRSSARFALESIGGEKALAALRAAAPRPGRSVFRRFFEKE